MYVVTGATGNIGKPLSLKLIESGKKVRVIGRDESKLQIFKDKGAEVYIGDLADADFLINAFKGAEAVFSIIPPSYQSNSFDELQRTIGRNLVEATRVNNVKYTVFLSSVGAHRSSGVGVVSGLGYTEELFRELDSSYNVMNLRPSFFMENFFGQIGIIKGMGILSSPTRPDLKIPLIATRDIAEAAFNHLNNLDFSGNQIHYLLGARDYTYTEAAAILGAAIGKPDLQYIPAPYEAAKQGMLSSGFMSENVVDLMIEFMKSMNEDDTLQIHVRDEYSTTPTTLEEFAPTFAYVYNM